MKKEKNGQARGGQVQSSQVQSGQVKNGQIKSSPARPGAARIPNRQKDMNPAPALVLTLLASALLWYRHLPALNLKSAQLWLFVILMLVLYNALTFVLASCMNRRAQYGPSLLLLAAVTAVFLLALLASSRLFHAKAYSQILQVSEGTTEDIPSEDGSGSIALMDTASAEKLGDRKIGSLSSVVSQFNVGSYTQIDYQGSPVKVASLRYDGFFKWKGNRADGVPGYVLVDPVAMEAEYVALEKGMTYVPSAWFSENLRRHLRLAYPTYMFTNTHFEIDEDGRPWYVAPVMTHTIGLFGGTQITGVVLTDPTTGDMAEYPAGDIPQWVDVVYSGDLICDQFNDAAQLMNGFINSIFGQKDCRRVTTMPGEDEDDYSADYGYVSKDGDIWIYTGVTSVNGDSSNLGFILSNERTEETRYIACAGADEFSAMSSAEGEVQEKGYYASFPSLINIEHIPTYIMVLKDASGLVKMYAAVNVEQYNLVATAATQKGCIDKYRALMNGDISTEEAADGDAAAETDLSLYTKRTVTVRKLEKIDRGGDTYLYLLDGEGNIYHARYADVIRMMLTEEGDTIELLVYGDRFALEE